MDRQHVFHDPTKLLAQGALKEGIMRAIQQTEGTEIDDIIYVLTEQLVFWQLTLFARLNHDTAPAILCGAAKEHAQ